MHPLEQSGAEMQSGDLVPGSVVRYNETASRWFIAYPPQLGQGAHQFADTVGRVSRLCLSLGVIVVLLAAVSLRA